MMKIWCNEVMEKRHKAIKEYWKQKTTEMHNKPRELFSVFKTFLGSRGNRANNNMIRLEVSGKIEEDYRTVAEIFAK